MEPPQPSPPRTPQSAKDGYRRAQSRAEDAEARAAELGADLDTLRRILDQVVLDRDQLLQQQRTELGLARRSEQRQAAAYMMGLAACRIMGSQAHRAGCRLALLEWRREMGRAGGALAAQEPEQVQLDHKDAVLARELAESVSKLKQQLVDQYEPGRPRKAEAVQEELVASQLGAAQAKAEIELLQHELACEQRSGVEMEAEISRLNVELERTKRMQKLMSESSARGEDAIELKSEERVIEELEGRVGLLEQTVDSMQAELDEANGTSQALRQQTSKELEASAGREKEQQESILKLLERIGDQQNEREQAEEELVKLRQDLESASAGQKELEDHVTKQVKTIASMQIVLEKMTESHAREKASLKDRVDVLTEQLGSGVSRCDEFVKQLADSEQRIRVLQSENNTGFQRERALQNSKTELTDRVEDLKSASQEQQIEHAKQVLEMEGTIAILQGELDAAAHREMVQQGNAEKLEDSVARSRANSAAGEEFYKTDLARLEDQIAILQAERDDAVGNQHALAEQLKQAHNELASGWESAAAEVAASKDKLRIAVSHGQQQEAEVTRLRDIVAVASLKSEKMAPPAVDQSEQVQGGDRVDVLCGGIIARLELELSDCQQKFSIAHRENQLLQTKVLSLESSRSEVAGDSASRPPKHMELSQVEFQVNLGLSGSSPAGEEGQMMRQELEDAIARLEKTQESMPGMDDDAGIPVHRSTNTTGMHEAALLEEVVPAVPDTAYQEIERLDRKAFTLEEELQLATTDILALKQKIDVYQQQDRNIRLELDAVKGREGVQRDMALKLEKLVADMQGELDTRCDTSPRRPTAEAFSKDQTMVNKLKQAKNELKDQLDAVIGREGLLRDELAGMKKQNDSLKSRSRQLEAQMRGARDDASAVRTANDALKLRVARLEEALAAKASYAADSRHGDMCSIQKANAALKLRVSQLEEELVAKEMKASAALQGGNKSQLERRIAVALGEASPTSDVESGMMYCAELDAAVQSREAALKGTIAKLRERNASMQDELDAVQKDFRALHHDNVTRLEELNSMKAEVDDLRQTHQEDRTLDAELDAAARIHRIQSRSKEQPSPSLEQDLVESWNPRFMTQMKQELSECKQELAQSQAQVQLCRHQLVSLGSNLTASLAENARMRNKLAEEATEHRTKRMQILIEQGRKQLSQGSCHDTLETAKGNQLCSPEVDADFSNNFNKTIEINQGHLEAQLASQEMMISDLRQQLVSNRSNNEVHRLETTVVELRDKLSDLVRQNEALKRKCERCKTGFAASVQKTDERKKLKYTIADLENRLESSKALSKALEIEYQALEAQHKHLQEVASAQDSELRRLRVSTRDLNENNIEGISIGRKRLYHLPKRDERKSNNVSKFSKGALMRCSSIGIAVRNWRRNTRQMSQARSMSSSRSRSPVSAEHLEPGVQLVLNVNDKRKKLNGRVISKETLEARARALEMGSITSAKTVRLGSSGPLFGDNFFNPKVSKSVHLEPRKALKKQVMIQSATKGGEPKATSVKAVHNEVEAVKMMARARALGRGQARTEEPVKGQGQVKIDTTEKMKKPKAAEISKMTPDRTQPERSDYARPREHKSPTGLRTKPRPKLSKDAEASMLSRMENVSRLASLHQEPDQTSKASENFSSLTKLAKRPRIFQDGTKSRPRCKF